MSSQTRNDHLFFISFRIVERILLNRDEEENSSFFNPFTTPALDVNETRQSPVIAPPMIFHEMEVEEKSIVADPQMRRKIIIKSVESQFIRTQQLVCFMLYSRNTLVRRFNLG